MWNLYNKCTKCANQTFGLALLPFTKYSNYHFGEAVMAVCCCSCPVHFTLTAHQLLARQWVDSHRQQLSLHNPQFQFFLPSSLCNLFHARHPHQYNISFLFIDNHSFRLLWSDLYLIVHSLSHTAALHHMVCPVVLAPCVSLTFLDSCSVLQYDSALMSPR